MGESWAFCKRLRKSVEQPFEYCGKKIIRKLCEGDFYVQFEEASDETENNAPSFDFIWTGFGSEKCIAEQ